MKKPLLFATIMLLAFSSVEVVVAYAVNGATMKNEYEEVFCKL